MNVRTLVVVAAALTLSGAARASTTTTASMAVSAEVTNSCTASAAPLAFGAYTGSQVDQSADLTVTCTKDASYAITLDDGQAASGAQRQLASGSERLAYDLYSDSGRTTAWSSVPGTGTGAAQTVTVFGTLPAGQNVAAGSYADTVVATITY